MTREQAKQIALKSCKLYSEIGVFKRWTFPAINNVSESDLIDQLVSVQPMREPGGLQLLYIERGRMSAWSRLYNHIKNRLARRRRRIPMRSLS